jgi:outer membrane protein
MRPLYLMLAPVFLFCTVSYAQDSVSQWSLADVTRIALEKNPDLKSASANYEATSHAITAAISGYLPRVDFTGNISETTLPQPSAGSSSQVGLKLTYSSAILQINQVLFDFGRNLAQINAARAQSGSAAQQSYAVKNTVILAVEQAFYDVIANQKLIDAAQQSLTRYQETYRRTDVLVKTGARPEFDRTQATVELSKAKLVLINSQNALELSKIALVNIMGMEEQVPFTLIEFKATDLTRSDQLDLQKLEKKALDFRPEMKSSELNVEASQDLLHGEMTNYLPTFGFQGFYGNYQPSYPDSLRNAWGAGLTASWNLFEGMRTTARVGEFASRRDQQEALREKQRENIIAEVATDYMQLIRAESNFQVSTEALAAAQENDVLAKKRYDTAVATILELLVANGSLISAEASAIQARYQKAIALEQLKTAVNAPLLN